MNRKLLLLNVALLGGTVYAGFMWRNEYLAAKARAATVLSKRMKPLPPPPITPLANAPAVMPSGYADIATKDLFDKSRNPTVVVEVPPPPPPKPVPPFPVLKGMFNFGLGDGLTALFAEKSGGPGIEVKPGGRIGQFTLISVNEQGAVFEWDGKRFPKTVEEILDRNKNDNTAEAGHSSAAQGGVPPPAVVKTPTGPGAVTGETTRACNPNDSTPTGEVKDGFRKVSVSTPFGSACRWEAVK